MRGIVCAKFTLYFHFDEIYGPNLRRPIHHKDHYMCDTSFRVRKFVRNSFSLFYMMQYYLTYPTNIDEFLWLITWCKCHRTEINDGRKCRWTKQTMYKENRVLLMVFIQMDQVSSKNEMNSGIIKLTKLNIWIECIRCHFGKR